MRIQDKSCHPWQGEHEKQKRNQNTGGGQLWRKEDPGTYKDEDTTCGEGDKAEGKPHPRGQMWEYGEKTKVTPRSKVGVQSPASASLRIIDFDLSEPAALHLGVTIL